MTDLTKLTVDRLRAEILVPENGVTFAEAVNELARRAQANDLVQAERDEFDEELHTCRAIVGATSEHLHVDLEEMVDKLRRTEADAHSWQELATARAQANDALLAAAQWVATAERDLQASALVNDGLFNAKLEQLQERCGDLRAALAAAPAPSSSGAPAPADPWAPVPCDDYDRNIHANPDANAWADFFVQVHPGLADKHDLMRAWFANAMMAMHDSPRCRPAPADSQREAAVDALAKAIVRAVSELPDRSSPADWPEAMIVEPGELRSIILQACAAPEPAPADAQREAAIEASPYDALGHAMEILAGTPYTGEMASKVAKVLRQWSDKWAAAVDLIRPAPPAPVDQDAKLRDAVAALETVATKQQKVELRDAAHRILQGYSPCMNCGKWARRSECHWPCNPIGKAPPAPVAPVADGEVEAEIYRADEASFDHGRHTGTGAADTSRGHAKRWKAIDKLRALIARRVAEARGAGLMEFKAWFAEKATWMIEATAEAPAVRGYSVAPRDIEVQIDRLLAAPPASQLAEEPAQEDDGPCLSALLANMRMEMSDGANGMRTPREEAIAAVVECVARRIEALENNKEAGK